MARTKKQPDDRVKGKENGTFRGFINHNMTVAEKKKFDEWSTAIPTDELFGLLDQIVDDGYVVSCKVDDYNHCYTCSLTCRNTNSENFGFVLSGRAPTPVNALYVSLFKHFVLLAGDWIAFHERQKEQSVWG